MNYRPAWLPFCRSSCSCGCLNTTVTTDTVLMQQALQIRYVYRNQNDIVSMIQMHTVWITSGIHYKTSSIHLD